MGEFSVVQISVIRELRSKYTKKCREMEGSSLPSRRKEFTLVYNLYAVTQTNRSSFPQGTNMNIDDIISYAELVSAEGINL